MPELNPTTRAGLRLWLAATLAIAMTVWTGRQGTLMLALMTAVLFVNENDTTPVGSTVRQLGSALVGIIAALIIFPFSNGWLMLSVALLAAGLLCRAIGLAAGVGMAYLCAWAVMVMGHGKHFDTAVVFNLALPAVLGVVSAQFATWLVWPRLRRQRLIELDEQLNQRFAQQSRLLLQWLQQGGATPPLPLRSSDVLPAIQQLQQLSSLTNSRSLTPTMRRRWAQLGGLWRQLLSQWLLLEPQLLALAAPLPAEALSLLQAQLDQATGMRPRAMELPLWRHWAERSGAPPLLALGLAMQLDQLQRLQYSQALLRSHGLTTPPAGGR